MDSTPIPDVPTYKPLNVLDSARKRFLRNKWQYTQSELEVISPQPLNEVRSAKTAPQRPLPQKLTIVTCDGVGDSVDDVTDTLLYVNLGNNIPRKVYTAAGDTSLTRNDLSRQLAYTTCTTELEALQTTLYGVMQEPPWENRVTTIKKLINPTANHNSPVTIWLSPPAILLTVNSKPGRRPGEAAEVAPDSESDDASDPEPDERVFGEDEDDLTIFGY